MQDFERKEIAKHIEAIMDLLQIERTPSNVDTPKRVAKMWYDELFKNRNNNNITALQESMTLFLNEYSKEIIILKDIEFNSICEHHWLPFSGKINIGYVPDKEIIGLSKIPRVVKYFSQKPQLQEQLVKEIGDFLFDTLKPLAIFIECEATHQCVKCRGAESNCSTLTSYNLGDKNYYEDFKNRLRGV